VRRAAFLFALIALAACADKPPPTTTSSSFALSPVVAPTLAELERAVPAATTPPAPDDDTVAMVEGLLETLASADTRQHALALEDLRTVGPAAVQALARMIDSAKPGDTHAIQAARALGSLATFEAAEILCRALEAHTDPLVRAQAAYQLGVVRDDAFQARMVLRLKYELDPETVVWLADALSRFGNLSGIDGLRTLERGTTPSTAADRLLAWAAEFGDGSGTSDGAELEADWYSGELERRRPPPEPSARMRLAAWRQIELLSAFDLRKVDDARFVLTRLPAWIVPELERALHDENRYTRVHAAQCFERMGKRAHAADGALLAALDDEALAPTAAAALGAIGSTRAVPELERLLTTSRDQDLRAGCVRALGKVGQASSIPVLLECQRNKNEAFDLRQAAAESLLALGRRDDVGAFLVECLTLPSADGGGAESAWEQYLVQAAPTSEGARSTLERWRALAPRADTIATADETRARRTRRAELVQGLLRSP
jgi:HEAT repeat protein